MILSFLLRSMPRRSLRALLWFLCCAATLACVLMAACTNGSIVRRRVPVREKQALTPPDLLQSQRYPFLVIDVQYMEGFRPDRDALHNLQHFLQQRLNKPGGIYLSERRIPAMPTTRLSKAQVDSLVERYHTLYSQAAQATIGILYTSCYYQQRSVLAHSHGNSCIVVYGAMAKEFASVSSVPAQSTIESTLLMHEMGHLMGLVDKATPMQREHQDRNHPGHCRNRSCLMYWQIGNLPRYSPLSRQDVPGLDSFCIADLRSRGGR